VGQGYDRAVCEIQIVDEEKAKKVCFGTMTDGGMRGSHVFTSLFWIGINMKNTTMSMFIPICMAIAGIFGPALVFGETLPASEDRSTASMPADSTEKNVRDRDNATLTPSDQAQGSKQDVDKTRRIRKAIMSDKSLSTNAQNIKIVTLNGRTTLRGPVKNVAEQQSILKKARKVVGTKNVENQLEVTGP
jgi:hypothetical protein